MDPSAYAGLLVIDKPTGLTSRSVVNRASSWFPRKTKIGHTGTLDPLASGVLVICVGLATRLTEYVQDMPKAYRAGLILGAASDTDDADGTITPTLGARIPSHDEVAQTLAFFVGSSEQVPPLFSAAKVTGQRAYDLARRGKEFALAPRTVLIHSIEVKAYDYPRLDIEVRCGKGTYIRSVARDLGKILGCGAYIASLRRLAVGCFHVEQACSLDIEAARARERLLPLASAVDGLPRITLHRDEAIVLLHGRSLPLPDSWESTSTEAAVCDDSGRLLVVVQIAEGRLLPSKAMLRAEEL